MQRHDVTLGELWPGLDLRHLAAFLAVAETHSFARAAETLGYTQPAVSQQVAALERIVGVRLFERASGRSDASLTEAGEVLAVHVGELKARLALAHRALSDLAAGEAGHLRVGAFQSALARILPHVLSRYADARPRVRVESVESNSDVALLDDLRQGSLDFAFALLPLDPEAFVHRELVRDEFMLVSRAGDRPVVCSIDELAELPLVLYRTCRSAGALLSYLEAHVGRVNIAFRSDDNAALTEMVRAGLGIAVLPELWVGNGHDDGLELTPLRGLVPPRTVVLAWRRGHVLTPAQRAFVDVAAEAYPPRALELAS
jgi:DNA-binding transcriptional LysR family regulator